MRATVRPRSSNAIEDRALALVRRFRRQRPLRAGSLIITIFGDAIAPRGGDIALGSLIRLAAPFGLTERLVRTSVGRLANDGWLESHRRGRLSYYRLSETGRTRFAEATLRIYGKALEDWNGEWTLIVAHPSLGRRREELQREMAWLGFGQVLTGMLAHPAHDLDDTRARLDELEMLEHVTILRARVADADRATGLVRAGWDLDALARSYERFIETFGPVAAAVASAATDPQPRTSFLVRILLIHEYRKIHLRDPLLPGSLLPDDWVGAKAYALCKETYARIYAPAEIYLSEEAESARGPLPPPSSESRRRFGGLANENRNDRVR
jgi:phenylacetic acid degradation operon negative regulatory protein